MVKESDKRKEEIVELKKRIEKLERDIDSEDKESSLEDKKPREEHVFGGEKKKYVRTLVILVIILLLMDVIALVAYYKPDIFKSGSSVTISNPNNSALKGKCSDGTREGECSSDKPYFCYEGNLVKKAAGCGCPAGYKVDFQDCMQS